MDFAQFLTDILIVLVAAKAAAEISERIGIPAVVGEIVAGIIVGPSVLGLVSHGDEVLVTLGEVGVILLLLEVGMEMDLAELGKVGRASVQVAIIGVVTPMLLGFLAMGAVTDDFNTKLFVAAALTATSVGITARVFGDLRALATTEARLVLGAAVADDVMGLVVLTVVVRLVTEGSVSFLSVMGIIGVAVAFLVFGGLAGLKLAGPLFDFVERFSRTTGTLVAIAFAFALGFARLAEAAQLAPIVGAFVAGIALSRVKAAPRISRELAPVGHLFIPVFFLQIGIDADVGAFFSVPVLKDATILLVVAVIGKLVAAFGAFGSRSDKWLIGLGMLPRGEVGLIFATIGLQAGVLGDELYAALLLVVLITTLITPPLLKMRYGRVSAMSVPVGPSVDTPAPEGGWLRVGRDEVGLAADPPISRGLVLGLRSAVLAARLRPTQTLLSWLSAVSAGDMVWDDEARETLLDVVERGNARSWRFLLTTGILGGALPEIERAMRDREADQVFVDASAAFRLRSIERLRTLDGDDPLALEAGRLDDVDAMLIALLAVEATDGASDRAEVAEATAGRIGFDASRVRRVRALAEDGDVLLWSAAHRPSALTESAVLPLATHVETPERARATYIITALRQADQQRWELDRLRHLHELRAVGAGRHGPHRDRRPQSGHPAPARCGGHGRRRRRPHGPDRNGAPILRPPGHTGRVGRLRPPGRHAATARRGPGGGARCREGLLDGPRRRPGPPGPAGHGLRRAGRRGLRRPPGRGGHVAGRRGGRGVRGAGRGRTGGRDPGRGRAFVVRGPAGGGPVAVGPRPLRRRQLAVAHHL